MCSGSVQQEQVEHETSRLLPGRMSSSQHLVTSPVDGLV